MCGPCETLGLARKEVAADVTIQPDALDNFESCSLSHGKLIWTF